MSEIMAPHDRERLEQSGRECFGCLTASLSHELNNVISIMDQNAGLLTDLLAAVDGPVTIDRSRLEKIVGRLQAQTERGTALIRLLNTFAHSVDEDKRATDLADIARLSQSLWRRKADMRRVEISLEAAEGGVCVPVRPFIALWALFLAVRVAIDKCPSSRVINIKTNMSSLGPALIVETPLEGECEITASAELGNLMNCYEGRLLVKKDPGRFTQELLFKGGTLL